MAELRLDVGSGPLRTEHERLLRTALRRGDTDPEGALADGALAGTYSDRARALARNTWRARMVHEHQSAAVFARLLPQLMAAAATLEHKTTVLRMAMDELRHASLCAGVVTLLGGEPVAETVLAVEMAALIGDLALTIHPHPTLSETVLEAAEVFHGQSPHLFTSRKTN